MNGEAWRELAACRGKPTRWWFPTDALDAVRAEAVCATCPVTDDCLRAGINEPFGVWGGVFRTKSRRALAAPAVRHYPAVCGTLAGWSAHQARREAPCEDCRAARSAYMRDWRQRHGGAA